MHQDRDYGQPTPDEYIPGRDTQDNRLLQTGDTHNLVINKPVTRDSLIAQHGLDPNDQEVSSLLDRILDLRDIARIKSFLPAIADRYVATFKSARRNGQTQIEEHK